MSRMETIRQQMIDLLSEEEMSAIEVSQELRIAEKEVYTHLPHIARSVATQGKKLLILPSRCLKCGYVFEERKRFTRPGHCPKCKATYIQRPAYRIS
jgi:predicted Zn-ribbon and HTH transcriptional regulator